MDVVDRPATAPRSATRGPPVHAGGPASQSQSKPRPNVDAPCFLVKCAMPLRAAGLVGFRRLVQSGNSSSPWKTPSGIMPKKKQWTRSRFLRMVALKECANIARRQVPWRPGARLRARDRRRGPSTSPCFVRYPCTMAVTDAELFRNEAKDCLNLAEKATSTLDKEDWQRLAAEWLKLAQEAESRGGRWFRT